MADNFVIEKLAYMWYQAGIEYGYHLSKEDDWKKAVDAIKFFEDREAPHDYIWESNRKKYEWLYPLYLNLTDGYEDERRLRDNTGEAAGESA